MVASYRGSCHCGAVRFHFESEEIATGARCNCSICSKRGSVMSSEYFPPAKFTLLRGESLLQVYRFGERTVNHYFCSCCGIYTFHDTAERAGHFRVNLACVEGIDPRSLAITPIDGKSF